MIQELIRDIQWLGQSGFRIFSGKKKIYVDPYHIKNTDKKADIILVTHAHYDHCSGGDIKNIVKDNTVIAAAGSCVSKIENRITSMKPGDKLDIGGVKVEAVRAYNTDKGFHPRENGWLGFIIDLPDGRRLYHAGDTDYIPEMEEIKNIDIAFLPVGGTYTMNAEEAAEAVKIISPKIAVPMHYGTTLGSIGDANKFASILQDIVKVSILKPE